MPIKNYTTKIDAVQTVGEIQGLLAGHGARKVMMDYSDKGKVEAVTFGLMLNGNMAGFKIVARPKGVMAVMKKDGVRCDAAQAEPPKVEPPSEWDYEQICDEVNKEAGR